MPKLLVFSGAGLSAESGLSTFRDVDGVWSKYDLDVVCNYWTWRENYAAVHEFYNLRRAEIGTVEPNSAHRMIADWQKRYETTILTQNIDDLLERAGCIEVTHLHGHAKKMRCFDCGHEWDIGYAAFSADDRCPECRSRKGVKPAVVFFGEDAPHYRDLSRAIHALRDGDVVLVTGTSGNVIAIETMLKDRTGYKLFNALEPPLMTGIYDQLLLQPATEAFPLIDAILRERLG